MKPPKFGDYENEEEWMEALRGFYKSLYPNVPNIRDFEELKDFREAMEKYKQTDEYKHPKHKFFDVEEVD